MLLHAPEVPLQLCHSTHTLLYLQARVQALDGGATGQKCEENPPSSVLQPWDRSHSRPTWNQLPGCLQGGGRQVHGSASRRARDPIRCLQHPTCRRPPACPHCPSSLQITESIQPPAEHPAWEDRAQWNNQRRGRRIIIEFKEPCFMSKV